MATNFSGEALVHEQFTAAYARANGGYHPDPLLMAIVDAKLANPHSVLTEAMVQEHMARKAKQQSK